MLDIHLAPIVDLSFLGGWWWSRTRFGALGKRRGAATSSGLGGSGVAFGSSIPFGGATLFAASIGCRNMLMTASIPQDLHFDVEPQEWVNANMLKLTALWRHAGQMSLRRRSWFPEDRGGLALKAN